jgi:hypothetical protein
MSTRFQDVEDRQFFLGQLLPHVALFFLVQLLRELQQFLKMDSTLADPALYSSINSWNFSRSPPASVLGDHAL